MKYQLLLFVTVALNAFSQSQSDGIDKSEIYDFFGWNFDWQDTPKEAYIFADASKLRSKPGVGSEVLGKLLIGDKVKVLGVSTVDTTINGVQSKWVHVESGKNKGYVWGGLLTTKPLQVTDTSAIVWGISRVVKESEDNIRFYASLKIFSKKQIIKQLEFEVTHADQPTLGELVLIKNPTLDGVEHIFVYNTLADACGVVWSEHYLFEASDGLIYFDCGYGMGEAALYYSSVRYIFPTKEMEKDYSLSYFEKPEQNQIFKSTSLDEYTENCVWTEKTEIETFEWKNNSLVPFCRQ